MQVYIFGYFDNRLFISNEVNKVYVLEVDCYKQFIFQQDEIEDLLWLDINQLGEKLERNEEKICIKKKEYQMVSQFLIN